MVYINSKRGVRDSQGNVVGVADSNSKTRKRPCGTFKGSPVIGWSKARKLGIVKLESRNFGCPCCEITVTWKNRNT